MRKHPLFYGMEFSENRSELEHWIPLMMQGRSQEQRTAATRMDIGTDVNFGALTRALINHLKNSAGVELYLHNEVRTLNQNRDKTWEIVFKDTCCKERYKVNARFVFIGAGGAALTLLEKSGIPEAKGYGGFPVSGQWLICQNPELVARHAAKVYGKAKTG